MKETDSVIMEWKNEKGKREEEREDEHPPTRRKDNKD